jgi:hypothetical protein
LGTLATTTTRIENVVGQCKGQSASVPAQEWAQQQSSNLFFYQTVASSVPTIVMTYILGLYTHQLGRKFVLILTMFGNVFQYAIWLFIIYFQVILKINNHIFISVIFIVTRILVAYRSLPVKFSWWW